ncbi:MAG: FTR1 family iron permease [Candidatus Limnocylindria bacterium]|nr:FTR1 family protein [Chloroflexota bacterium]MDQ3400242.1 FTR1 family protein [Chloroflexota bacterium]
MTAADLSALLISLREGIEMALVVGILLAYLSQVGARRARRWVWAGVGAAAAVSLGFLALLNALGASFEGTMEQVFEGTTMLLAAVFLTWMILWMLRNARYLKGELQRGVADALARGAGTWGLFAIAFFAVVREGVELALLLFAAPGEGKLIGALVGLALALGVGVVIYVFGRRIDLQTFFRVTSLLLVFFAAGLVAHAAHEFAEAGILSAVEGPKVWSTKAALADDSGLGSILRALFGYQDEPTVIEIVAYLGYLGLVWLLGRLRVFERTASRTEVRSGARH